MNRRLTTALAVAACAAALAGCKGQPDPARLALIGAARTAHETFDEDAALGVRARANPDTAEALGVEPISDEFAALRLGTIERLGAVLADLEAYERGTLDPDRPVEPVVGGGAGGGAEGGAP